MDNLNIAALIGSRICHDLISPIGAIHNGLELLDMSGGASGPEMGLISESVVNAEARIRFFRLAYGTASDHKVSHSEVVAALKGAMCGGRIKVLWHPDHAVARWEVQLALLSVQCLEVAMPYGGDISISQTAGGWEIEGRAERLSVDPVLWSSITDTGSDLQITPDLVQFALLPLVASDSNRQVQVDTSASQVAIRY